MKIYIAAPFFKPDELKLVKEIENLLTQMGVPFFSPRLNAPVIKELPEDEREQAAINVFQSNINGLWTCNTLLHVLLKDEGSAWESGYWAASKGIKNKTSPIICMGIDLSKPLNVMYRQVACAYVEQVEGFKTLLQRYKSKEIEGNSRLEFAMAPYSQFSNKIT